MVASTSRAMVGPGVAYAFTRSPWAHAAALRQMHRKAPGRLFLGLGPGTRRMNSDWFCTQFDPVLGRMQELIGAIRAFLGAENMQTVKFEGEHYSVNAAIRAPVMGPIDIPILIGAFNKGMLGVVGRVADGIISHGIFTDRYWQEFVDPRLVETASAAGRDPAALKRWGWLIAAINDEDPARATLDARRMVAFYLTVKTYDTLVGLHGWEEPVARVRACFAKGDTDGMAAAVSDEMLNAIALHGSTENARRCLASRRRVPELAFLSPPSFLVSDKRRQQYARAAIRLASA
jgi:alkanesulfonate monooxygenase SsuD/methylene tetrahydromethanopterin reductase-like flavin-dependent oxidoreductase (luciferase family)